MFGLSVAMTMHGKQRKLKSATCVTRRCIVVTWFSSLSTRIGKGVDLFQAARELRIIRYGMVDQTAKSLPVHLIFVFFYFSFLSFLHA